MLAALWGLTLAGRFDPSPSAWLILAVLVLPWLHAASWALLLLLCWPLRRARGFRTLLALHLALALAVRGGSCATTWVPLRDGTGERAGDLRALSWNIGRMGVWARAEEGRCDLAATREALQRTLRDERPDVIALLEITGSRLDALARAEGLQCTGSDYRGQGLEAAGGIGICVPEAGAWRIRQARELALPPGWRYVFAELSDGTRALNVLALHVLPYGIAPDALEQALAEARHGRLDPLRALLGRIEQAAATQAEQVAAVRAITAGFLDPTLVLGDLNSTPDSAVQAALRRTLDDAWLRAGRGLGATRSVGGWLPLRIDYAYSSDGLRARQARTLDCRCEGGLACSDHRALVVDYSI